MTQNRVDQAPVLLHLKVTNQVFLLTPGQVRPFGIDRLKAVKVALFLIRVHLLVSVHNQYLQRPPGNFKNLETVIGKVSSMWSLCGT